MKIGVSVSVAVWSGVNVAGVRLQEVSPLAGKEGDPEEWDKCHQQVIDRSAYLYTPSIELFISDRLDNNTGRQLPKFAQ